MQLYFKVCLATPPIVGIFLPIPRRNLSSSLFVYQQIFNKSKNPHGIWGIPSSTEANFGNERLVPSTPRSLLTQVLVTSTHSGHLPVQVTHTLGNIFREGVSRAANAPLT